MQTHASWRKSSRSNPNGECVEVGQSPGLIAVRDVKQAGMANRPMLVLPSSAWRAFTGQIKEGTVLT